MNQWSLLPMELLNLIEESLDLYHDKVRLRCICSSWRSCLLKMPNHNQHQLPWLLLPHSVGTSCAFFDSLEKKVHKVELPEAGEKVFKGSAYGWVVVAEKSGAIFLLNPLTRNKIKLPSRSKFPDVRKYRADKVGNEYLIWIYSAVLAPGRYQSHDATHVLNFLLRKVILSSSPTSMDFVAVALYGEYGHLAYCKRGDKKWSLIDNKFPTCDDIIFHEGQLYALKCNGQLMVCDIDSCLKPIVTEVAPAYTRIPGGDKFLVGSSSGLMMIRRCIHVDRCSISNEEIYSSKTLSFMIFKLDTSGRNWYQVQSLGDDVLFLGLNSSLAISSHDYPVYKRNCIYFTDVNYNFGLKGTGRPFDEGVFCLDEKKIEPLPTYSSDLNEVWPAPIWVTPNPY